MSNPFGDDAVDFDVTLFLSKAHANAVAILADDWMPHSAIVVPVTWPRYAGDVPRSGSATGDGEMGGGDSDGAWPSIALVAQRQEERELQRRPREGTPGALPDKRPPRPANGLPQQRDDATCNGGPGGANSPPSAVSPSTAAGNPAGGATRSPHTTAAGSARTREAKGIFKPLEV